MPSAGFLRDSERSCASKRNTVARPGVRKNMRRAQIGFLLSVLLSSLPATAGEVDVDAYPWLGDMDELPPMQPLHGLFATPKGYERVPVEKNSFGAFLRELPVRSDRTQVLSYDGDELRRPAAAVVAMDVGARDLQQCADSVIRLHAEWLWSHDREDEAGYHFTSGHLSEWSDWQAGERFVVKGSSVDRVRGGARADTHKTYRGWLDQVFMYAGTRSLPRDSDPVPGDQPLRAGDFFVQSGSPGHAVIILDIAEDGDGNRVALMGQGFMPAEDFHVLGWPAVALDSVWFPLPTAADGVVDTPSWAPFARIEARRFK